MNLIQQRWYRQPFFGVWLMDIIGWQKHQALFKWVLQFSLIVQCTHPKWQKIHTVHITRTQILISTTFVILTVFSLNEAARKVRIF